MSIDRENAAKRISVIDIRSVSCANTIPPFFPSSLSQYRVYITIEHFFPFQVTRVYSTLQRKKPLFRFEEKKRRVVRPPRCPIYFSVRSLSLSLDLSKATLTYRLWRTYCTCGGSVCRRGAACAVKGRRVAREKGRSGAREATPANRCHKARTCVRTEEGGGSKPRRDGLTFRAVRSRYSPVPTAVCSSRRCSSSSSSSVFHRWRRYCQPEDLIRLISSGARQKSRDTLIYTVFRYRLDKNSISVRTVHFVERR